MEAMTTISRSRAIPRAMVLALLVLPLGAPAQSPAWMRTSLTPEQRATLLVRAMTLPDKFQQLTGAAGVVAEIPECFGARHVPGIPRLHIPTLRVTNGPVGIGQSDCVPVASPGLPRSALMSTS